MAETKSQDQTEHLKALGKAGQGYNLEGPDLSILEIFPNNYPGRPYMVSIEFPEFTSLCPVTGQPDFATIILEYVPDAHIVESKSFKLYMFAYRNHRTFMETVTNQMLDDFSQALKPLWLRVKGIFSPRGGTRLHVFAERYKEEAPQYEQVRQLVREWKSENGRHSA